MDGRARAYPRRGRAVGRTDRRGSAAAQSKPAFYPAAEALFMRSDEFERALGEIVTVEVGSLITAPPPREGWAPPIEIKSQPSLRLGATELTGGRSAPSFEPLAAELSAIRRAQARALMVVEGANQAGRLKRHLQAFDIEANCECKSFAEM